MPEKYRSEKADTIERELSRSMNMISRVSGEAQTTFKSGKELERRGKDSSPGVAQKLTASGVGTLVARVSNPTLCDFFSLHRCKAFYSRPL